MVDVSAPRVPKFITHDGRIDPNGARLLERFLHDLWERTGGSDDEVRNLQLQELFPWKSGNIDVNEVNHPIVNYSIKTKDDFIITTSVDFTTTSTTSVVICNASLTVTLNPNPEEHEVVTVIQAGATPVTVSGGTRNINDSTTYMQIVQYESNDFVYSVENDQWYIK